VVGAGFRSDTGALGNGSDTLLPGWFVANGIVQRKHDFKSTPSAYVGGPSLLHQPATQLGKFECLISIRPGQLPKRLVTRATRERMVRRGKIHTRPGGAAKHLWIDSAPRTVGFVAGSQQLPPALRMTIALLERESQWSTTESGNIDEHG